MTERTVEHANARVGREVLQAFATGDMATLDRLIADDARWHEAGSHAFAGDFEGKQAIFGHFGAVGGAAGQREFRMEIHDVVANDEHTVGLLSYSLRRPDGTVYRGRGVQVFHVRDGRVTESWGVQEDPAALGAAMGG